MRTGWAIVAAALACRPPAPAPPEPETPPAETVDVGHRRELRGVWIATVANIDFPSSPGLDVAAQQAELIRIVDLLAELRFNAVFFQVRPEADALYHSDLEPWSRFLTGTQGRDPGYDPLAFLVHEAHARAIEVHAWFNPYRASSSRGAPTSADHVSEIAPTLTMPYGTLLWMDPGRPEVRARTVAAVLDVVRRYDVDGIHFDDYFYPYPNGADFPDEATYKAYVKDGGTLSRADWRRSNVEALLAEVSSGIRAERPSVRFGVSPFGIYRPGQPEGIKGLDQVEAIYADPLRWLEQGTVDYLAPQLYWPTTQEAQAYEPLMDWWVEATAARADVYVGHYLSKLGETPAWSIDELRIQRALARANPAVGGDIWFSGKPLLEDREGVQALFREMHAEPALAPPVRREGTAVAPPAVRRDGEVLCIDPVAGARSFVVYADDAGAWRVRTIVPAGGDGHVEAPIGRYAVTSVDARGVESVGVLVE